MSSIKQKNSLNKDVKNIIFSYEKVFTYADERVNLKTDIENLRLKQKQFISTVEGIKKMQKKAKTKKEKKAYNSMIIDLKKQYKKDYSELKQKVEKFYEDGQGTPKMKLGSPKMEFVQPLQFTYLNYHNTMLDIEGQNIIAMCESGVRHASA